MNYWVSDPSPTSWTSIISSLVGAYWSFICLIFDSAFELIGDVKISHGHSVFRVVELVIIYLYIFDSLIRLIALNLHLLFIFYSCF